MRLAWVPLVACLLLPHALGMVSFHDWQCGSEERSRQYAYDSVMDNCPTLAAEMNHCCAVHDECYVRQAGQDKCDEDFCHCNQRVLNRTEGALCRPFADTVCALMPFVGIFAYDNSVNYTEPEDLPKNIPADTYLSSHYKKLYTHCPKVNSTLSSCAVLYDNCLYNEEKCATQLCHCVRDAYTWDHDEECDQTTAHICHVVHERSRHMWFVRTFWDPTTTMLLVVVLAAICVSVGYFFIKRRRDDEDNIKYTTVIDA